INNAGLASGLASIENGDIDDWDIMIDTNIKGLLYVTRNVVPLMISRGSGHIINIGSIAGKEVYANGNVYCSTKHAVDALNRSMRIDLAKYPIKVSAVHPGAVETEFSIVRFKGDAERASKVYEGFENLVAADVADAVGYILSRPAHVNINDLVIMPTAQPCAGVIHRK
ncbi:MAG: SDR family NAD(P)-dependent oxidoreductase, partial [Bacteroidia bacterium]|nr:SDR family NAD(P)-dependent oxidoreductase [Bacteroidia bacterium]